MKNDFLEAEILHRGAELCSLRNEIRQYIWQGDSVFWGKHSPVLFPIVGTLFNNEYCVDGIYYQMNRHGFARDLDFELISKHDTEAVFILKSTPSTLQIYPFEFVLKITYQLINSNLKVSFDIENNSQQTMPFSIGAHPAFSLPQYFENYQLVFSEHETLDCFLLENDLLTDEYYAIKLKNKFLKLEYDMFLNDALVFKKLKSKTITILENNNPLLQISFLDFKNLGIWTKIDAPFICIEPWLGYADIVNGNVDFFEKEGIQILSKNSKFDCSYMIGTL